MAKGAKEDEKVEREGEKEEKKKGSFSTKFQLEEGIIDSEAWANFPSVI